MEERSFAHLQPEHQLDVRVPIKVRRHKPSCAKEKESTALLLRERYDQCRRTLITLDFYCYARRGAKPLRYNRLVQEHVVLSCPTPAQARAAIKLIQRICEQMDGKFLDESE